MTPDSYENLIQQAYAGFNERNFEKALSTFHAAVQWPKAFEGGYVNGHAKVEAYWTRQWGEINPHVEPTAIKERPDGTLEVTVHQVVKDLQGNPIFDGMVKHVYRMEEGLLRRMDIEAA